MLLSSGSLNPTYKAPIVPEFLTAKRAIAEIEEVITEARSRLILVSAYFKVSDTFMNRLRGAVRQNVEITFLAREGAATPAEIEKLLAIPNLSFFTLEHLHAKCYLNENRLVITSLNLYEASEKNWEMGVSFTADEPIYGKAVAEVSNMLSEAKQVYAAPRVALPVSAPPARPASASKVAPASAHSRKGASPNGKGSCIRCADEIRLNPEVPLCRRCFSKWAEYKNTEFTEKYCHDCGKEARTSLSRPLCRSCFAGARA